YKRSLDAKHHATFVEFAGHNIVQLDIANIEAAEQFDLDLEFEQYEEIEVPDFTHGRRGRFIHDFAVNKTGIVDMDGQRCFVMPLNRTLVLPPHSLFDLIVRMRAGYYEVDTEIVRERMRVVTPPILDFRDLGYYIARECSSLPTYRLERMTNA
ncbi:integral membrane protein 2B, partial [Ixodes scapularis]